MYKSQKRKEREKSQISKRDKYLPLMRSSKIQ